MDNRERFATLENALQVGLTANRADMWTALPGIFQSFDPVKVTATVQPAIQGITQNQDGSFTSVNLPILQDVPVCFPHGGGGALTFPIRLGDECLIVFSSRCIDAWWQNSGVQIPMEKRMHDLSDGFAIPGPYSVPRAISNISTTAIQMRSDDGAAFVEINPSTHAINVVTSGNVSVTAGGNLAATVSGTTALNSTGITTVTTPTLILNGNLQVNGGINSSSGFGAGSGTMTLDGNINANGTIHAVGDITSGTISLHNHTHGGVQTGPSSTGVPQ